VLVDASSGLDVEVLNNEMIQVWKHNATKGAPAQVIQIPAVDPAYWQELDRTEGKAYSIVGMSELWANSEKPAGISSGRGLEEMNDITSTRFLDTAQLEDQSFVDLARANMALASSIPGFSVVINGEKIAWSDVELSEDEYDLSIAPSSILPDTSPGLIQKILDDSQIDAQLAADQIVLFDSLDHESYIRKLIAPKLACEKLLDEMFYDHKSPELKPNLDLGYLQEKAVLVWNQAYLREDAKAMDLLEGLLADIKGQQDQFQQALQQKLPVEGPNQTLPVLPGTQPPAGVTPPPVPMAPLAAGAGPM
jgi:hypothetical protein